MEIPGCKYLEPLKLPPSPKWDESLWDDYIHDIETTNANNDGNTQVLDLEDASKDNNEDPELTAVQSDQSAEENECENQSESERQTEEEEEEEEVDEKRPTSQEKVGSNSAEIVNTAKIETNEASITVNTNSLTEASTSKNRIDNVITNNLSKAEVENSSNVESAKKATVETEIKVEFAVKQEIQTNNEVPATSDGDTDNNNVIENGNDDDDVVVIVNSDSDIEIQMYRPRFNSLEQKEEFEQLRERARQIIFNRLISRCSFQLCDIEPEYEEPMFPYEKLKELHISLQEYIEKWNVKNRDLNTLWENVLQWLTAIKLSCRAETVEGEIVYELDLDEKYNLIMVGILAQYINFKTEYYKDEIYEARLKDIVQHLWRMLAAIFSNNSAYIAMTLLRIEIKLHYRFILDPIFRLCLTDPLIKKRGVELVDYLRYVLCFKRWKTITPLKVEREKINELAIGKQTDDETTEPKPKSQLPKAVPKPTALDQEFPHISDLIKFAMNREENGTRTILVNTSPDLEDAIEKYFILYGKHVTRPAPRRRRNRCRAPISHNFIVYILIIRILFWKDTTLW